MLILLFIDKKMILDTSIITFYITQIALMDTYKGSS